VAQRAKLSDIVPVVEAGPWAVHVPAALSWSYEHAGMTPHARGRYLEVGALDRVPHAIEALVRT
jgi:putative hydrolase of the HAD superfamily